MPKSTAFAHYLMGHAPFRRAPFFYAYVGMWLHLLIGTGFLALSDARDWPSIFAALVIGSLCMGLVLYSRLTKRYGLLINIGAYAASIARAFSTDAVVLTCFSAGLIAALVSGYSILAAEYRHYQREGNHPPAPLPKSAALLLGAAIVLLFILGIKN
ncbi:MAG: hypothetical protein OXE49_14190 [Gemmatimonadetes bacterium]|nr:hypothetical protein [Gemmatimonadota bacterium]